MGNQILGDAWGVISDPFFESTGFTPDEATLTLDAITFEADKNGAQLAQLLGDMGENPADWADETIEAITAIAPVAGKYYHLQKLIVTKPEDRESIDNLRVTLLETARGYDFSTNEADAT